MSPETARTRHARPDDLEALTRIYNHYVRTSHVTFDLQPYEPEQRRAWLAGFSTAGPHCLVVLDRGQGPAGYACSTPLKSRPAYAVSVETSVYLDPEETGHGFGELLMRALLEVLPGCGIHGAYAGVALPNDASEQLHRKLGYHRVGLLSEVGRKFDRYWDVAWYEKRIGNG